MPNPAVDVDSWAGSACYPRRTFYPLSDGPTTKDHRITKPDFRPCSTCLSHSQAPLTCLYTPRLISIQPEGTFGRLRYRLGGDRPSQTARLTRSPAHAGLDTEPRKSGISPLPPPPPRGRLPRLPPILRIRSPVPMPSYSKAPRGLFVLARGTRIFTGTAISPSPSLRQRPSRYTFRAGRNLPDKEFRSSLARRRSSPGGHEVPARRHAVGTISSSEHADVRRMVSEDSDRVSVIGLSC